jgi:VanZ family protein
LRPNFEAALTLKDFVADLERLPIAAIEGHAKGSDFSRWIAEVFGDQPLALAIAHVEDQYRRDRVANLRKAIVRPIRER